MTKEITTLLDKVEHIKMGHAIKYGSEEYVSIDLSNLDIISNVFTVKTFRQDVFSIHIEKLFDKNRKEPYFQITRIQESAVTKEDTKTFTFYPPFDVVGIPLYGEYTDNADDILKECLLRNKITYKSNLFVNLSKEQIKNKYPEYFV